ncbi:hypothetical protein UFOVP131_31 [uncultured Caudovirales phage]|uniref:Uncharacterized protein n=1 Tax=uncultured Caudovirales phage TaxID=2100421 RepID=A0A6J5LFP4_9CAUD|nr:hypothetical protein UFOVP131_31 [uncultured Caudovirales phage]
MNFQTIIDGLQKGLETVEKLAPVAEQLGGGKVAALVGTLADIAGDALERVEEGTLVASEREQAVVRAINTELAAKNDALAAAISKS